MSRKLVLKFVKSLLLFGVGMCLSLWLAPIASAHVSAGEVSDFWHGLQHPMGGLDHILAMVAVGLWGAQLGGRAVWALPLAFVCLMAVGWVVGMAVLPLPFVEQAIIASDLVLGGLVMVASPLPLPITCTIVGFLAVFHGYAHGTEMPQQGAPWQYGLGFVTATIALHLVGLGLGWLLVKYGSRMTIRWAGAGVVVGGIYVLVNALAG